jgi:hypothetical protein
MRRRRTEDELCKALAMVEREKAHLRINADDEHVEVLLDAVSELLTLRKVVTTIMQYMEAARSETQHSLTRMDLS